MLLAPPQRLSSDYHADPERCSPSHPHLTMWPEFPENTRQNFRNPHQRLEERQRPGVAVGEPIDPIHVRVVQRTVCGCVPPARTLDERMLVREVWGSLPVQGVVRFYVPL